MYHLCQLGIRTASFQFVICGNCKKHEAERFKICIVFGVG